MLFFPSHYAFKQFSRNVLSMLKKVPIMLVCHGKKFAVEDGERLVRVLFYTLLRFDSLQLSVDCPTAPALPTRRDSCDLMLSHKVRKPRHACSIMTHVNLLAGLLEILWLASEAIDSCWATTT